MTLAVDSSSGKTRRGDTMGSQSSSEIKWSSEVPNLRIETQG